MGNSWKFGAGSIIFTVGTHCLSTVDILITASLLLLLLLIVLFLVSLQNYHQGSGMPSSKLTNIHMKSPSFIDHFLGETIGFPL